ncbi:MAG: glycine cleavage system aminomethyltransferase GcvT [Propionibacterium sp.]|nr:glycine cleavage system aminomethyltransferase GcvT [Propionibacterium sp.]
MTELLHTPLHAFHTARQAKMVPFAGWEMPIQYPTGVIAEHLHTREAAGLFDVSHMGQLLVRGDSPEAAAAALETVTPASVVGLQPWRQRYGLLTSDAGGILDDFMFAHHGTHFLLVVNAARTEHDLALLRAVPGITVEHVTDRALLALQGPRAEDQLARLIPGATDLVFMDSAHLRWGADEVWVSRSGYTGEDGFEISLPAGIAPVFADALLSAQVVWPVGLGARDSLRLEAGMPLYGNDLTDDTTPARAGIGWAVPKVRRPGGSRAGGYPGADVIGRELADGPTHVRMGLRPEGRAPIREGAEVFATDDAAHPIGVVTSGGFAPSLGHPVAMATLPAELTIGTTLYAEVRGKRLPVDVTALPFVPVHYKR